MVNVGEESAPNGGRDKSGPYDIVRLIVKNHRCAHII
jgi:hypothetical protein